MRTKAFTLMIALLLGSVAFAQQQTGTISGRVTDEQGAVLPGVTVSVSSPVLIGGTRTTVTSSSGTYQLVTLPPGMYSMRFEMSSFAALHREGVIVRVATITNIDAQLKVGSIQESITVTGESPVVDVRSTITQTNITKELYEAVPTGRNPWVMAGLVPGVATGQLDVGGNQGMQQYGLEAFGSADSQKSFSIDGLKTNWPGGNGGATMQYYDFGMYEEYNFQTASGTAESDVGGIYMNMVTKSGGNEFHSDNVVYFMNDALQGNNIDDDLRRRVGLQPGQATGIAGNPIDISYDWNSTLGGPIVKDKAWFFGAVRWWRLDQFQIGATNPDGSQAIDDNRIRNFMGKVSYQMSQADKLAFMFNRNLKDRFHRRNRPFSEDKATWIQDQPAQNFVLEYNRVLNASSLFNIKVGRMWGTFPLRYQPEIQSTDISYEDTTRDQQFFAAPFQELNPNSRFQFNASLTQFKDNLLGGSHDFKLGVQVSREQMIYERIRNGDVLVRFRDGAPNEVVLYNTPFNSDQRVNTWGVFAQDSWTLKQRLTLNLGLRFDGIHGFIPDQTSPAGTFFPERQFAKIDNVPDWPINVAPRLGFSYDLLGDGKTAIKGYYGRFYVQIGVEMLLAVNPNSQVSATAPWVDSNGDRLLALGPSGTFRDSPEIDYARQTAFTGGTSTRFDGDSTRPYSDEINFGVDHTLTTDWSVALSYHRRQHRNGMGILDLARPPSAYTASDRAYVDPINGPGTITVYNLAAALRLVTSRIITNVSDLESDYNGVVLQVNKRMSNRWQLLAGLTLQKHEGFLHNGTYTGPNPLAGTTDFNDPNTHTNRDGSRIFLDLPWVLTVSGSYMLPYDIQFAAKYLGRKGDPLERFYSATGLVQGTTSVRVVPRGTDRTETVNQFIDLRFAKRFAMARNTNLEGTVDLFNVLNANHVLNQNTTIGTTLGRPSLILAPRVIRFGVKFSF